MAETGQEKTEQATPRRKREARGEGNVAKSMDLTAALMLLAAVLGLQLFGLRLFGSMRNSMQALLGGSHTPNPTRVDDLGTLGAYGVRVLVDMLMPLSLLIMAVGLVAVVGQVGFILTGKPLVPDPKKLNPIKGIQQMVNARAGVRLLMSLGKVILIGAVASVVMYRDMQKVLHLAELPIESAFLVSAHMVFELALVLCVLLIVLALLDFWYQRWQQSKDLMMTKEQVKQEMKDMDGDPLVKQRRARVARQLAMQRLQQDVPTADVIVTNPTHFSVALKYDSGTMRAPRVVAKGADFMAMRIRQIADLHGIPRVERKPLARALYANVDVGQEVPEEHYAAVAELLAYVYRLSGQKAA
ncbi:MAG: flagellar biosynthesis protein FlhB [Planctomycetota bacterium]